MTFTVIKAKCDPQAGKDKKLPTNSYLVEYEDEGGVMSHDLLVANKQVDVFDHYYDKYKKGLKKIIQTEGRANSKTWSMPVKEKTKGNHPLDPPPAPKKK